MSGVGSKGILPLCPIPEWIVSSPAGIWARATALDRDVWVGSKGILPLCPIPEKNVLHTAFLISEMRAKASPLRFLDPAFQ
jgi:hypothetical protein